MDLKVGVYVDGAHYCYARNHFFNCHRSNIKISNLLNIITIHLNNKGVNCCNQDIEYKIKRYSNSTNVNSKNFQHSDRITKEFNEAGFITFVNELKNNQQKGIDVEIAFHIGKDIIEKKLDLVVLIASDTDFISILKRLKENNIISCVINLCVDNNKKLHKTGLSRHSDYPFHFWSLNQHPKWEQIIKYLSTIKHS